MLRKKIKKFIYVFMAVCIAFSSILIASAYDVDNGLDGVGGFKVGVISIGVFNSDGIVYDVRSITNVTGADGFHSDRGIQLNVTTVKNFKYGETLNFVIGLDVANDSFLGGNYLVSGSYNIGLSNSYFAIHRSKNDVNNFMRSYCRKYNRTSQDNYYMEGTLTYEDTATTEYALSTFSANKKGDKYNHYVTKLTVDAVASGFNNFNIALYDFNFQVVDPLDGSLTDIKNAINSQSVEIKANITENFNEIMYGWQNNNSLDNTSVNDYESQQTEIIDSTADGRDEMISIFNNFGSMFSTDGHLYKGLYVTSKMFTELFSVSWVSGLVQFSLAVGIFSFLIGAVNIVVGRISRPKSESPPKVHNHYHFHNKRGK